MKQDNPKGRIAGGAEETGDFVHRKISIRDVGISKFQSRLQRDGIDSPPLTAHTVQITYDTSLLAAEQFIRMTIGCRGRLINRSALDLS